MSLLMGLRGYWPLEGSGTNALDATGGGIDGTLTNSAVFSADGKFSGAVKCTATFASYVGVSVPALTALSICAWVKPSTNTSQTMTAFSRAQNGGSFIQNWLLCSDDPPTNSVWRMQCNGTSTYCNTTGIGSNKSIDYGVWQFLVGTVNYYNPPSCTVQLYKNGVLCAQNSGATGDFTGSTQNGLIGGYDGAPTSNAFNGAICHVGLWDRVLSAAEVAQLWNGGAGLPYPFGIRRMGRPLGNRIIVP